MSYGNHKNIVRKKDGQIIIGDNETRIKMEGRLDCEGNLSIKNPFNQPNASQEEGYIKVLHTDGIKDEWRKEQPQTLISNDSTKGLDFVFVNSTQAFLSEDSVVLNPCGATRETGVISYLLGTKIYLNNTISHDHYQGEHLIKI